MSMLSPVGISRENGHSQHKSLFDSFLDNKVLPILSDIPQKANTFYFSHIGPKFVIM